MSKGRLVGAAVLSLASIVAHATTYESVTFEQLVQKADVIFIGEVADVRSFEVRGAGRSLKTRVTFRVVDPIYGANPVNEVFDFLGGTIGDETMEVAGMPTFAIGDRRVVFARRDGSISPIVGFSQGLLKVSRDAAGVDRVLTHDGYPVARTQAFGAARPATSASPIMPMTVASLRASIVTALAAAGKR